MTAVEVLRERVTDWELTSLAAQEQGDHAAAERATLMAVVLFTAADRREQEREAA